MSGTIFDIKKYAIHDGPGIRTTVFFQGCPLSCWWCHNPESQSRHPVLLYRANRCARCGSCVEVCPQNGIELLLVAQLENLGSAGSGGRWEGESVRDFATTDRGKCDVCGQCAEICYHGAREVSGREMSVRDVLAEIERDIPFYDQSGGGVTFSGGEPFMQPDFLAALLRACKAQEIHTVVDTSGLAAWKVIDRLRGDIDLFLYDLKLIDDERHKQVTGVSNQLILGNLERLARGGERIEIRIPLIPGINDDPENLSQTAAFIGALPGITNVELMAYHDIAAAKYEALGLDYQLPDTLPPSEAEMLSASKHFEKTGLNVKIS